MALGITFVLSGDGTSTFTTAGSALESGTQIYGGTNSVATTPLFLAISATHTPAVTAYATGVEFTQTLNGSPGFEVTGIGNNIFTFICDEAFSSPVKMSGNPFALGTIGVNVSADGAECASGVQTGTFTLTLSNIALTGNSVRVDCDTSSTVTLTVTAVNTPDSSGNYTCAAEARRLWALGYVG